jgi:CRISP-associated protein Cas1
VHAGGHTNLDTAGTNLIDKFVNGFGLDPYYGFMHRTHNSFQALVYDLIEPFRWLVEYAVYKLAVEEPRHFRR